MSAVRMDPGFCPSVLCEQALEAAEDSVLVRLGTRGVENTEYVEEIVEAVESCRSKPAEEV